MDNIIEFDGTEDISFDVGIDVGRTEEFNQSANKLSDFISSLPLNRDNNDQLIALVVQQVLDAEEGAYEQGFRAGVHFAGLCRED